MKTALYVAAITRAYRKAIDDCMASEKTYRENLEWYRAEVSKCTNRRYTTGFYFGRPDENTQIYNESTYVNEYIYLGIVEEVRKAGELPWQGISCTNQCSDAETGDGRVQSESAGCLVRIEQRNKFSVGDTVEIMRPDGSDQEVVVNAMYDETGTPVDSCPHAKQTVWIELTGYAKKYDLLRVKDRNIVQYEQ